MKRKIVLLAGAPDGLYVLCNDTSLWFRCLDTDPWKRIEDVPQDDLFEKEQYVRSKHNRVTRGPSELFNSFWEAYPKKVMKTKAIDAWNKASMDDIYDEIMDGLGKWKASKQWLEDGGIYITNPFKWLSGGMWQDSPPAANNILQVDKDNNPRKKYLESLV